MATSTVEDYLKAIFVEEQRDPDSLVTTGRIAVACDVAPGTATSMVKTLADSSLVTYEPYSGVRLTDAGRQLATRVLRRHRLVELFLVNVLEMDWSEVHEEAERLEHVVSDNMIARIDEMLGHPTVDPHGDPIPDAQLQVEEPDLASLATCPLGEPLKVARVRDQTPAFLRLVEKRSLKPGSRLTVKERDPAADTVEVRLDPGKDGKAAGLSLGYRAATKILVEPG